MVQVKTDDIYEDTAEDVEARFDTSNHELDRLLTKWKDEKVIGLMKDKLGGTIMTEFVGLGARTYIGYLIADGSKDKIANETKKSLIERKLKSEDYKNCLEAAELGNEINHLAQKIKLLSIVLKKIIKNS